MRASTQRERNEERKAYMALRRAVRSAGVKVSFAEAGHDANYVIIAENHIVLKKGMSLRETLYVLAHEYGHVQSHFSSMARVYTAYRGEPSSYIERMANVVEELDAWALAMAFIPRRLRIDCESYASMCLKTYAGRKAIEAAKKLTKKCP